MPELPAKAVEALANELLLYRFGGHLVEGDYHINCGDSEYHRAQAIENARRILEQDRLGIRKQERLVGAKAQAVVVDFLDSWRFCPVSETSAPARSCLEDAAKQLLAALDTPEDSDGL